jgi:hypothetical protein
MSCFWKQFGVPSLIIAASTGCGTSKPGSSPVMVEAEHTHYHVHAVDASHDHSHADGMAGGHEHAHTHEPAED